MKKKVLFINGHLNTGGVEKSLVDILRNMNYEDYCVDLMLTEDLGDYIADIPEEVNLFHVDFKDSYGKLFKCLIRCIMKKNLFCFFSRIILSLKKVFGLNILYLFRFILPLKDRYDIVIAFRHGFCSELGAFGIKGANRIIWWHHGELFFSKGQKKYLKKIFEKYNHIVTVSDPIKEELNNIFPKNINKTRTVSNMIDTEMIMYKSIKENPYINEKNNVFVSVGRIAPEKHFENVVYASLKLIQRDYRNFRWYIVGGDWDYERIKSLVIKNHLENYIKMIGKKTNPYPYVKYANLYIHTSYVESQGLSVLEAMSLGCPCVVTKSLGVCSFVKQLENAILVDQNVESLVDGIITIYDNNQIKEKLVKNAYLTCSEYKPEMIMNKIYRIFNNNN